MEHTLAQWSLIGASVEGNSHKKTGLPCQDAFQYTVTESGWAVIAVSDGAGSAPLSHHGSETAVRHAVEELKKKLDSVTDLSEQVALSESALNQILVLSLEAVKQKAEVLEASYKDLACTLLLVAVSSAELYSIQVGDGAIVFENEEGVLKSLTKPANPDEYVNVASFLTSGSGIQSADYNHVEGRNKSVAVFTDGIELMVTKYPSGVPHAPFFKKIFDFSRSQSDADEASEKLRQMLDSPKFREKSDDDMTLVVLASTEQNKLKMS